jgi:hypothetical protein
MWLILMEGGKKPSKSTLTCKVASHDEQRCFLPMALLLSVASGLTHLTYSLGAMWVATFKWEHDIVVKTDQQ